MTLVDFDLERAVTGCLLLATNIAPTALDQEGLRPEHFAGEPHRRTIEAVAALVGRGDTVDVLSVATELRRIDALDQVGGRQWLDDSTAFPASLSSWRTYVRDLQRLAHRRALHAAAQRLAAAATSGDDDQIRNALTDLDRPTGPIRHGGLDGTQWAEHLAEFLVDGEGDDGIPLPFAGLTEATDGGFRKGEIAALGGWTNHGKTIVADQILDTAAAAGARVHLYMTEMTVRNRGLRALARRTGISLKLLRRRDLTQGDATRVLTELRAGLPYGVTPVYDWTVDDICRDIRRAKWDLCVIDHIHDFPYRDERDLAGYAQQIAATARATGCCIVVVCQLNEQQMQGRSSAARPRPGLHSIKGASAIKQAVDTVVFVWQKDDEDGMPTGEGAIWTPKARNSGRGAVSVVLDTRRLRFTENHTLSSLEQVA